MDQKVGPYSSPGAVKHWAAMLTAPMMALISGEITATVCNAALGAVNVSGSIKAVWLSVEESGKDDTNTLSFTVDVKINGTTCLTTQPIIAHVSGEASTNKTTKTSLDTGVTQSVMDASANDVTLGDMLTYEMTLTRTASPTTEMRNIAIAVEIEPA